MNLYWYLYVSTFYTPMKQSDRGPHAPESTQYGRGRQLRYFNPIIALQFKSLLDNTHHKRVLARSYTNRLFVNNRRETFHEKSVLKNLTTVGELQR